MPSRNPHWERDIRHRMFVAYYREFRSLYGEAGDQVEAAAIREECEEAGLPMGYGRIGRQPRQLAAYETPPSSACRTRRWRRFMNQR